MMLHLRQALAKLENLHMKDLYIDVVIKHVVLQQN